MSGDRNAIWQKGRRFLGSHLADPILMRPPEGQRPGNALKLKYFDRSGVYAAAGPIRAVNEYATKRIGIAGTLSSLRHRIAESVRRAGAADQH
jgi:hypothetical protein